MPIVACIRNSRFIIKTVTAIAMQEMITTAATEVSDPMIADILDGLELMWMYVYTLICIECINLNIPVLSLGRTLLPSDSEPESRQVKPFGSGVHMPLFVQLAMKSGDVPLSLDCVLQVRMT